MRNLFLPLMVVFLFAACGPRDIAAGGADAGKFGGKAVDVNKQITVSNNGDLSETCPGTPYSTLTSPEANDALIAKGAITAAISMGDRNCMRIGDVVPLQVKGGQPRDKVKILRVEIIHASKMTETQAKALNMNLTELQGYVTNELAKVKALPKGGGYFDAKGMVNITFFEFAGAAAPPTPALTDIVEVKLDGTVSSTCPKDYTPSQSIDIPEKYDVDIISGQLIGFLKPGDQNCYQIGSIVSLQVKPKVKGESTPVRAKLKIAWVELVPVSKLNADHAAIMNMTLDELKAAADTAIKAVKFDAKNTVSITVFEYVAPTAP